MLVRADVFRPLEEHVLEEVGKAGSPRPLIRRAHVIPEIYRNDRCCLVLRQCHQQPVIEPKLLYRYSHVRKLIGPQCQCNPMKLRFQSKTKA